MELLHNFDELLQAAMTIEEQGSVFYKKAAGIVTDTVAQQLFLDLVEWENGHYQKFAGARERLGDEDKKRSRIAEDLDIEMIMASGAIKMTKDPASLLKGDEKPEQIIDVAISLERDSIVFYMFLSGFVKDVDRREELETVIREEVGHVKQLQAIRDRVAPK